MSLDLICQLTAQNSGGKNLELSTNDVATARSKRIVYAQHGRELMGWKSPVGELAIQILESFRAE